MFISFIVGYQTQSQGGGAGSYGGQSGGYGQQGGGKSQNTGKIRK